MSFKESTVGKNEFEKNQYFTLDQLKNEIDKFQKRDNVISDEYHDKKIIKNFEAFQEEKQKNTREFIKSLEDRKDLFKYVFKTLDHESAESGYLDKNTIGSYYFVLDSGESLRFRWGCQDGEYGYKIQPIMKNIFFINKNEKDKIQKMREHELFEFDIIDKPISLSPISIDTHPLELTVDYWHSELILDLTKKDTLIIKGIKLKNQSENNIEKQLSGGLHIGHPISKIIKK